MLNPQLLEYIKSQLAQGVAEYNVRNNLITQGGWSVSDVNEAFSTLPISNGNSMPLNVPQSPHTISPSLQKKSAVPLLISITILVLLLIGAGAYIYFNKNHNTSVGSQNVVSSAQNSSTNTYTDPIGLYSLQYPKEWTLIPTGTSTTDALISSFLLPSENTNGDTKVAITVTDLTVSPNTFSQLTSTSTFINGLPEYSKQTLAEVDGFPVDKYVATSNNIAVQRIYSVDLGQYQKTNPVIIIQTNSDSDSQLDAVVESILINKDAIPSAMSKFGDAVNQLTEQTFTFAFSFLDSESYLKQHSNSYSGFCKFMSSLGSGLSTASSTCMDAETAFAITVPLPYGGYWCGDSTGYQGEAQGLNTGTICIK